MQIALAMGVEIVKEGSNDTHHEEALDLAGDRRGAVGGSDGDVAGHLSRPILLWRTQSRTKICVPRSVPESRT